MPTNSKWRPVAEPDRIIRFDGQTLEVSPSMYAGKRHSFYSATEYGIWREKGGGSRYALIILSRLRPSTNYVFGLSLQRTLAAHIESEFEDELVELGQLQTIAADLGALEFQPFRVDTGSCAAIRWFGWKQNEWMGVRGTDVQLGTAALRGFYCEVTEHPISADRARAFANAIRLRENPPW
ncbi:MAG: hypothetical protein ACR2RL_17205 [Gammaproteobacteria bacterium]